MGVLELWLAAESSADLQHHEKDCHVDVLGAVGMASVCDGHTAIYRLKYMNDPRSLDEATAQFVYWTRKTLVQRRIRMNPTIFGKKILLSWLDDVCRTCGGRGHEVSIKEIVGNYKECRSCGGTGKTRMQGSKDETVVFADVVERADAAVENLGARIIGKLGRK